MSAILPSDSSWQVKNHSRFCWNGKRLHSQHFKFECLSCCMRKVQRFICLASCTHCEPILDTCKRFVDLRRCYTKQFFLQLATQRWRIKYLSSCRGGVTRLQRFSQLATRTITNKVAEISREWNMSSDWPILTKLRCKLHASNLSPNVAKSRGSFYFSCNSQRNNCSCKMGCYTWSFSCNLQRKVCCVASCKKNCFV